eukprot:CAMPEP_0204136048 /NCGR_PEP_ID=MMETSP0361-20130328/16609_1 /ASSEMBLY_ACC=CAM_ASM_000343 /TAXON_ID=268821 /ORGANISM="Scrippsiella Hangoei, Strain SHTV-5" /LENGTH=134 /DNA_ID=CAMNT_0051089509 /DNA_START=89 /DNA_END=490 /DNA_ORIENTATION=+
MTGPSKLTSGRQRGWRTPRKLPHPPGPAEVAAVATSARLGRCGCRAATQRMQGQLAALRHRFVQTPGGETSCATARRPRAAATCSPSLRPSAASTEASSRALPGAALGAAFGAAALGAAAAVAALWPAETMAIG